MAPLVNHAISMPSFAASIRYVGLEKRMVAQLLQLPRPAFLNWLCRICHQVCGVAASSDPTRRLLFTCFTFRAVARAWLPGMATLSDPGPQPIIALKNCPCGDNGNTSAAREDPASSRCPRL